MTAAAKVTRRPEGLADAGQTLWDGVTDAYDLAVDELVQLETACRQADAVAALEAEIERDGYTVAGSAGQRRLNMAVPEARQGRIALSKLIGALRLPDEENKPMTLSSKQAKHAAEMRWARERKNQERRDRLINEQGVG